jgi:hypothetical protein
MIALHECAWIFDVAVLVVGGGEVFNRVYLAEKFVLYGSWIRIRSGVRRKTGSAPSLSSTRSYG